MKDMVDSEQSNTTENYQKLITKRISKARLLA